MKKKLIALVCTVAIGLATTTPTLASPSHDPAAVAADVVILRPALLVATAAGSVIFVVALPFAALSKSVKHTADSLVVAPAAATFTRPLGDLDYEKNSSEEQTAAAQ